MAVSTYLYLFLTKPNLVLMLVLLNVHKDCLFICTYVYFYSPLYLCLFLLTYVPMSISINLCTYVYFYEPLYLCLFLCICGCLLQCIYGCLFLYTFGCLFLYTFGYLFQCTYVCMTLFHVSGWPSNHRCSDYPFTYFLRPSFLYFYFCLYFCSLIVSLSLSLSLSLCRSLTSPYLVAACLSPHFSLFLYLSMRAIEIERHLRAFPRHKCC